MSEDRQKYIEVIGEGPSGAEAEAFQAARRSAEALAKEAGVKLLGLHQVTEVTEEADEGSGETAKGSSRSRLRYRVRFGFEPVSPSTSRAGFGFIE